MKLWNWFWQHQWWGILEEALQGDHDTVTIDHTQPTIATTTPIINNTTRSMPNLIYASAKDSLGKRMTLNDTVPPEVGCAEAVSTVLQRAGVAGIPATGIASTLNLYTWLKNNTKFEEIDKPEPGAVVISPTGTGNGKVRGHTGIVGAFSAMYSGDYGICSNDSNTGLFLELWSVSKWQTYYESYGGLPMYYFRAL